MSATRPLLILGLGNVLCGDDGIGVVAVTRLAREYEIPEGVRVLDGGTLGLSLLPYVQDAGEAILVDAIAANAPPGSIVHLEGSEVDVAVRQRLSPHQVGVADLMAGLQLSGRGPARITLLGMVPERIELFAGLSEIALAAMERLLHCVVEEAASRAAMLRRRHETEDSLDDWSDERAVGRTGM